MNHYFISREEEWLTYETDSVGDRLVKNMVMSDGKYFFPRPLNKVKSFNMMELNNLWEEESLNHRGEV